MKPSGVLKTALLLGVALMLTACRSGEMPVYTLTPATQIVSSAPESDHITEQTTDAQPSPEQPEQAFYHWDPHIFDLLSEGYQVSAERLADAILSYEESVTLEDGQAEIVADNFAYEFPPAALVDLSVEGNSVKISYLYDRATHENRVAAFEEAVEGVLNETLEAEDSESVRALLLYEYVVNHVSYFTVDYTEKETTAFSALTEGVTICYGYADAFGYLLRQTGMEAHLYRGARSDGAEHGWCYAKVDGKWYHFDPTWECSNKKNTGVTSLTYFAMDDALRFRTLTRTVRCGFGAIEQDGIADGAGERLIPKELYPCYKWSFDREKGELTCLYGILKFN